MANSSVPGVTTPSRAHISDTLVVIDSMSQQRLARMAALAQDALGGKRTARTVLASLRAMALELQNDINFAAELVGCNAR